MIRIEYKNRLPRWYLYYDPKDKTTSLSGEYLVTTGAPRVRAVFFTSLGLLYFFFYEPDAAYHYGDRFFTEERPSSEAVTRSMNVCQEALLAFIAEGMVSFENRVLFWQLNDQITSEDLWNQVG